MAKTGSGSDDDLRQKLKYLYVSAYVSFDDFLVTGAACYVQPNTLEKGSKKCTYVALSGQFYCMVCHQAFLVCVNCLRGVS